MCSLIWAGHLHLVKLMVDLPFCECVYPNKYCTERMVGNAEEGCSLASHTIITLCLHGLAGIMKKLSTHNNQLTNYATIVCQIRGM